MPVNLDKPHLWKNDVLLSVDMYNDWFMEFAPEAFRSTRVRTTKQVKEALESTENLTNIEIHVIRENPAIIQTLRMATCPPIAVDRLIGLAGVSPSLVKSLEIDKRIPPRMPGPVLDAQLEKIAIIIERLSDPDILVWKNRDEQATEAELTRAATIIADRLCGSVANPIIRNAQEKRQLAEIKKWLEARSYRQLTANEGFSFENMPLGTFSFRMNVPVRQATGLGSNNIPIDVVIMPFKAKDGEMPILIEAKSAGDYTNTNKRRKEEAAKMAQLKSNYGSEVKFNLFLCGYFDTGYLGYEAAEGIDWVWEHRISDMEQFGL